MESYPPTKRSEEVSSDTIWDEIKDIERPEDLGRFLWKIITGERYKGKVMSRGDFIRVMNELQEMAGQEGTYTEDDVRSLILALGKKDLKSEARSIIAHVLNPYKRQEAHINDMELLLNSANSDTELAQDLEAQLSLRTPLHRVYFINQLIRHIRAVPFDVVKNRAARAARARLLRALERIEKELRAGAAAIAEMDVVAHEYRQFMEAVKNPKKDAKEDKGRRESAIREEIKRDIQKLGITDARVQKELTDLVVRQSVAKDELLSVLARVVNPRDALKDMKIKKLSSGDNCWRIQLFTKRGKEYRILYQVQKDGSRTILRAGTRESLGTYRAV